MNITWNKVLWFTAGAVVGAAVTANFFKTKYERIAQEDIDSVKRAFSMQPQSESVDDINEEEAPCEPDPADVEACNAIIRNQGYSTSSGKEATGVGKPFVISPGEFDTLDDYEAYSLTYYEDGTVTDEQDNPIEDIDAMIGSDFMNHYGEYEEDAVHVRNPNLRCDFEILRDLRNYSDVCRNGPRPNDD